MASATGLRSCARQLFQAKNRPSAARAAATASVVPLTSAGVTLSAKSPAAEDVKNTPVRIMPSPAPALIESSDGEASGLRVIVCKSSPLTANTAPTNTVVIMRGNRTSSTTR